MDQHLVAPDEVRDPKVEPAAFVRDERRPARDLALDEGEYLTALVVEAARPRSAVEPLALDVLQQIDDGRRPRVAGAPDRATKADPDSRRFAVGHVPRRDEVGDLPLGHRPVLDGARRQRQRVSPGDHVVSGRTLLLDNDRARLTRCWGTPCPVIAAGSVRARQRSGGAHGSTTDSYAADPRSGPIWDPPQSAGRSNSCERGACHQPPGASAMRALFGDLLVTSRSAGVTLNTRPPACARGHQDPFTTHRTAAPTPQVTADIRRSRELLKGAVHHDRLPSGRPSPAHRSVPEAESTTCDLRLTICDPTWSEVPRAALELGIVRRRRCLTEALLPPGGATVLPW